MRQPSLAESARRAAAVGALALAGLFAGAQPAAAADLGIEGQVFEPIEEDFRLTMLRLVMAHDWSTQLRELEDSAQNYTKNLPALYLPTAAKSLTRWKDAGVITTEDIYLPTVTDWENGSVFEPEQVLAIPAGTYVNPLDEVPAAGIERLFIFDATDERQLALAKELMRAKVPQLSFMLIAGDLKPLSEEMHLPVYYPAPLMLEKFNVRAVPTLLGFGRSVHHGHMAITEFALPSSVEEVKSAWFGLGQGFLGDTGDAAAPPAAPDKQ